MRSIMKSFILLTTVTFILGSCVVSKKQFDELLTEKVKLEGELSDLNTKMDSLELDIEELEEIGGSKCPDAKDLDGDEGDDGEADGEVEIGRSHPHKGYERKGLMTLAVIPRFGAFFDNRDQV